MIPATLAQSFLEAVEAGEFPLAEFNHAAHVRLAWIYLGREPLPEAMICFRDTLKRFAAKHGKLEIYNETITFMFLLLIHERIHRPPTPVGLWEDFSAANHDLIIDGRDILKSYYSDDLLSSLTAKRVFCLPDRRPQQSHQF